MKATIIKSIVALVVGIFAAGKQFAVLAQHVVNDPVPDYSYARENAWQVFFVIGIGVFIVLHLPQIWRYFLRGTSDFSNAVRGKDVGK